MQNSVVSTPILAKIYRPRLKECAYHKIQQYFDQNYMYWKLFYIVNSYFPCHFVNAFGLAVLSNRPSSFASPPIPPMPNPPPIPRPIPKPIPLPMPPRPNRLLPNPKSSSYSKSRSKMSSRSKSNSPMSSKSRPRRPKRPLLPNPL